MLRPNSELHVLRQARINAERRTANSELDLDATLERVFVDPIPAKVTIKAIALEGSPDLLANSVAGLAEQYGEPAPGYEHHLVDLRDRLHECFSAHQELVDISDQLLRAEAKQSQRLKPRSSNQDEDHLEQQE